MFITLPRYHYFFTFWTAYTNINLHLLHLLSQFVSLTIFAYILFLNVFTCGVTIVTLWLGLRVHSGPQLYHSDNDTLSFTFWAGFRILAPLSITFHTYCRSFNGYIDHFAIICILKCYFCWPYCWLELRRFTRSTFWSSRTEKDVKYVSKATCRPHSAIFKALKTILVIYLPFFFIAQYFVCCIDFLEFFCIAPLVWMIEFDKLSIWLLQFVLASILFNP